MCLLGWMKRGIHAKADRRAARRVITPSLSAPVCPGSCPNTQTLLLAPHIKDPAPDCSLHQPCATQKATVRHKPSTVIHQLPCNLKNSFLRFLTVTISWDETKNVYLKLMKGFLFSKVVILYSRVRRTDRGHLCEFYHSWTVPRPWTERWAKFLGIEFIFERFF